MALALSIGVWFAPWPVPTRAILGLMAMGWLASAWALRGHLVERLLDQAFFRAQGSDGGATLLAEAGAPHTGHVLCATELSDSGSSSSPQPSIQGQQFDTHQGFRPSEPIRETRTSFSATCQRSSGHGSRPSRELVDVMGHETAHDSKAFCQGQPG